MLITIQSFTLPADNLADGDYTWRLWYPIGFLDSSGQAVASGTATTGTQLRGDATVSGGFITFDPIAIYSTLDAQSPFPQSILISSQLFKNNTALPIYPFNQSGTPPQWIVPDDLGATISFEDWTIANQRITLANPPQTFYTAAEVDALIEAAVDQAAINQDYIIGDYDSFAAAITAVTVTGGTLVINQATTCTATTTVPANITLRFTRKGSITVSSTKTLTIVGPIEADPAKIFYNALSGQGTISFTGNTQLTTIYPQWWGATGDGSTDDTTTIRAMAASVISGLTIVFPPGTYRINIVEQTALVSLTDKNNIRVVGHNATIRDVSTYVFGTDPPFTPMFQLDSCDTFSISGVDYLGDTLADPGTDLGYKGGTFVYAKNATQNVTVDAYIENARYGVASGQYADETKGNNVGFFLNLRTLLCGYSTAHYLAENVNGTIVANKTHRTAYLGGVIGINLRAYFKNQYIADVQVQLTDAKTGLGTSRGCKDVDIVAVDMGTTISTAALTNTWATGITMSRVDAGTVFENIRIFFSVRGTNSIATNLGGFITSSSTDAGIPEWISTIILRNIKISGVVDRSTQTVAGNTVGEIYVNTEATDPAFYATVDNFDFDNVIIKDATVSISAATNAVTCVITTTTSHGFSTGQTVVLAGFASTLGTAVNGSRVVTVLSPTTFSIPVDTSASSVYGGSGATATNSRAVFFVNPGLQHQAAFSSCDFSTAGMQTRTNTTSQLIFLDSAIKFTGPASTSKITFTNASIMDISQTPTLSAKSFTNSTANGAGFFTRINQEELTLSGADVTFSNAIPAGCILLGVTGLVTTTITGATGYTVGVSGALTRFADTNTLTSGSTFTPTSTTDTSPRYYTSATDIIVTAKTNPFSEGAIRLVLWYINFTAPSS